MAVSLVFAVGYNAINHPSVPYLYKPYQLNVENDLTVEQVRIVHRQKEALFIDARPAEEFEQGHIPDAINIPARLSRSEKMRLLKEIPHELKIIVYCNNPQCHFADRLAREMQFMKYKSVVVFNGGWEAWNSGQPGSAINSLKK